VKQVLQHLRDGQTVVDEIPSPSPAAGRLLIRSRVSLISAGTERMLIDFGRAGLVNKARQQPERVHQVLEKLRSDGLGPTVEAVRAKLDRAVPLGYCNVGTVIGTGAGSGAFATADRVVSNGPHGEMVSVPVNLCAPIPDGVSDETASFTVLGAIALQAIRLVAPTLGEAVVVTGLGLVGLMAVQLLRSHGCRVLGIDPDPARVALARGFGAEAADLAEPLAAARAFSRGRGVDAVIIAAATASSEPVHQAALMCRKRGRIVLVGTAGLELSRADFFEKELTFQVSCSYGPGRYDPDYEEGGNDYPFGFVRWTEQRNFEAVLDMMAEGRIDVAPLISHRFPVAEAEAAYRVVGGSEPSLGVLLQYPAEPDAMRPVSPTVVLRETPAPDCDALSVAFIGAGNYATRVLMPAFRRAGARLDTVVTQNGVTAMAGARKFGFRRASTDVESALADPAAGIAVIATRHDSHAGLLLAALVAGKHVFVEKPLCLTRSDLQRIEQALAARPAQRLMVGFNRRFAPQVVRMKELLGTLRSPKVFAMVVNAGAIAADHWTQDRTIGGGRILGEGCHHIDLLRHLAGSAIVGHSAVAPGRDPASPATGDTAILTLSFADGSLGTIHYLANGHRGFPKERLEVFCAGRVLQLDNFIRLRGWGWRDFRSMNLWRQDKGADACVARFLDAIRSGAPTPVAREEIIEVSSAAIALADALG